jgi:SpoVK/Ycf46/Vps4 family AAA+-type ATPase
VASKYIGETEKNLARLLERAEELDVVLLFDEADALFGKRSEVKDSHDRYANQETAYLLQRLADHPGSVIVTARRPARLDGASLACAGFRAARSAKR